MYLKQLNDAIYFGTDQHRHKLSTDKFNHFTEMDVTTAANNLAEHYPDQTETIDRFAVRLMEMV